MTIANRQTRRLRSENLEARQLLAADLSVTIEPLPAEVRATEELTYVVTIRNDGPDDAQGTRVEIPIGQLEGVEWTRQGPFAFPPIVDLAQLNGRNGFSFADGPFAASAGDINADGVDDFIASDYRTSFVLFGGTEIGGAGKLTAEQLDGTNGFVIRDVEAGRNGRFAGDINGDGIDDVLVGSHILFGANDVGSSGEVSTGDRDAMIRITEDSLCDACHGANRWGIHAAAGDINGDGFDDLAFANPYFPRVPRAFDPRDGSVLSYDDGRIGSAWVIFGGADFGAEPVHVEQLDGTDGFQIHFDTQQEIEFGDSVRSVGDANGDGYDDLFITARWPWPGSQAGHLVHGGPDVGASGEVLIQPQVQEGVTQFFSSDDFWHFHNTDIIGDLNQDGFDDLFLNDKVIYGRDGMFDTGNIEAGKVDIATPLLTEQIGFQWEAAPVAIEDVDGDGHKDTIFADRNDWRFDDGVYNNGAVYVVLQDNEIPHRTLDVAALDGGNGFMIPGANVNDSIGVDVTAAGDFNGDGINDLVIGSGGTDAVHIVFGSQSFQSTYLGDVSELVDIPSEAEVTYTVRGVVPFHIGGAELSLSAQAKGNDDSNSINDSSLARLKIMAAEPAGEVDLRVSIKRSDGATPVVGDIFPGDKVEYTVDVANDGSVDAAQANIASKFDDAITDLMWQRVGTSDWNAGDLDDSPVVRTGETISYTVTGLASRAMLGEVASSVAVESHPNQKDVDPTNNSATHIDQSPLRTQQPELIGFYPFCFDQTHVTDDKLYFIGTPEQSEGHCFASRAYASSGFWGGNLTVTDGTRAGTHTVKENIRSFGQPMPLDAFYLPEFADLDDILYFPADDGVHGRELWRTDGSEAGTYMLKNILPDRPLCNHPANACGFRWNDIGSEINSLTTVGDMVYFTANDGQSGRELWKTDGSEQGTALVKDIAPGDQHAFRDETSGQVESWSSAQFTEWQGDVYFVADDGEHGRELWKTDGTSDGTLLVQDIRPLSGSNIQDLRVEDGALIFEANDGTGVRTWSSDGTAEGTQPIGSGLPNRQTIEPLVFEDGNYYLVDPNSATRTLIADSSLFPKGQPSDMHVVGDKAIVLIESPSPFSNGIPTLYSFDLDVETVQANGPFQATPSEEWTRSYATEFRGWSPGEHSAFPVPYTELSVFHSYQQLPVATTAVLGNNDLSMILTQGSSVTLEFPASIVDGPGDDLIIHQGDFNVPVVSILNTDGDFVNAGTPTSIRDGGVYMTLDISPLKDENLTGVVRFEYPVGYEPRLFAAEATIRSSVTLSASATNNPDLEFSWDLNQDGVFADRKGATISLSSAELAEFGLTEPGDYMVTVRMNDRVSDYFDNAILTIPDTGILRGDLNGDRLVGFSDFLILSASFGRDDANAADGDIDGDGSVTFSDFLTLSSNFGRTADA